MTNSKLNNENHDELNEQVQQFRLELERLNEKFHQQFENHYSVDEQSKNEKQAKSKSNEQNENELNVDHLHNIIENITRQQPLSAITVAAGIGFLVGTLTRR